MRIGRAVSSLLLQHVKNTVKTFEELLSSNKIDYYVEQHFREQLAKGSQLAESLASKFNTDDCISKKNQRQQVLRNLSILRELQKKGKMTEVLETKQDARPQTRPQTRSSSHAQSAAHRSSSSTSPLSDEQEVRPAVDVANVSPATPADSGSLPSNHSEAMSAQPFYPLSGTTQLSGTPDPGLHGSSGPWDEMRPQKMNASGNLSSFSSLYQPNSKPSGADLLEKNLVEIRNLRQRLEESIFINDRLQERLEYVLSNARQGKSKKGTKTSWFCPHLGSFKRAYRFAVIKHIDNQRVAGCELNTSLLSVNKEGKECQFLFGAVSEESSLSPSRLHCSSVSPSPGTAQPAPDVSLATPHSHTESHYSGSGKDIL
ncbi:hypothetical protein E2I00_010457 [Balaenoptera physalus]|uniref:Olduvai domain-containing protein n=1 Tax=Balaenoptera physalus TaxID=9770 RepID=A0A643C548_BALPH|nr:hypothetical protein E2I00_010457 [Balaenoptera physalus]